VNLFVAIILGIIQGLTEFLPVSSTAHLTIAGKLFGVVDLAHPEAWTQFIAVMQLGTVTAVLVYFWKDVFGMAHAVVTDVRKAGLAFRIDACSQPARLAFAILIGTLPVAIFGFTLKHLIEGTLTKSTIVIAWSLIALAALLWLAEKSSRHARTIGQITWLDGFLIGCAQALALIPGSSRSGTTMTAGLFLGFAREAAARFSFLLSIPAVLASGVYEMTKISSSVFALGFENLLVATVVSGVVGYAAIAWLLRFLMNRTTMVFVWYRCALGVLLLLLLLAGKIEP
jgi:undecaprenyl-diphosphatase